jgi:hypothetical protein
LFARFAWSIFGFHADLQAIYGQVGPAAGVLNALEAVEATLKLRKRKSSPLRGKRVKKVKTNGKAGQDEEDGGDDTDRDEEDSDDDADMGSTAPSAGGDEEDDTRSAPTENRELEGRLPTEDGMAPRIDDPTLQGLLEEQDKVLQARSFLTEDDVAAGRYPGFSAINRLALKWVADHPQISAVRNPHQIAPE